MNLESERRFWPTEEAEGMLQGQEVLLTEVGGHVEQEDLVRLLATLHKEEKKRK